MRTLAKFLAGGVAAAALVSAAPAAAQYYPGYGYGSSGVVGSIINSVLGGGYGGYGGGYGYSPYGYGGGYGGYGMNSQALVSQCTSAVQARLARNSYSGYGYGGYGYAGARVLGVSTIEPRGDGGLRIRGVATSGTGGADLTFSCKTDYRGFIRDVDIDRNNGAYGYGYSTYNPYDYSQYGYRRY
jgi:hypothetical protein